MDMEKMVGVGVLALLMVLMVGGRAVAESTARALWERKKGRPYDGTTEDWEPHLAVVPVKMYGTFYWLEVLEKKREQGNGYGGSAWYWLWRGLMGTEECQGGRYEASEWVYRFLDEEWAAGASANLRRGGGAQAGGT